MDWDILSFCDTMTSVPLDCTVINGMFGGGRTLQMKVDHRERILSKDVEFWKEVCALQMNRGRLMNKFECLVKVVQILGSKSPGANASDHTAVRIDAKVLKTLSLPIGGG